MTKAFDDFWDAPPFTGGGATAAEWLDRAVAHYEQGEFEAATAAAAIAKAIQQ